MFLFFGGDQRKYPVLKLYSFHNSPLLAIHVHSFPFSTLIYLSLLFPCLLLSCNSLNLFPSPPFPYAPFLSFPFPIFPYPFLSSPVPFLLLTFPILSCCSFLSSLPWHSFPILSFAFVSFPFLASFNILSFLSFPFLSFLSFPYASVSCPYAFFLPSFHLCCIRGFCSFTFLFFASGLSFRSPLICCPSCRTFPIILILFLFFSCVFCHALPVL